MPAGSPISTQLVTAPGSACLRGYRRSLASCSHKVLRRQDAQSLALGAVRHSQRSCRLELNGEAIGAGMRPSTIASRMNAFRFVCWWYGIELDPARAFLARAHIS
jgi:hypothetical protein